MSTKSHDLKPGNVFEFYVPPPSPDSDDDSDDDFDRAPMDDYYNKPRVQESIYLGKEQIDGKSYVNMLTVNNRENFTKLYKMPESQFNKKLENGFLRDKQNSKIPSELLKDVKYSVKKQKEGIDELEKLTKIKLPSDVKNNVLSFFQTKRSKKTMKQNYPNNGGSKKKRKTSKKRKMASKKTRKYF